MGDRSANKYLASGVYGWLLNKGCAVTLYARAGGSYEVYYTLPKDVLPQPAIIIENGKVRFPAGSQEAVLMSFFSDWGMPPE
jgi:hypothetical protein